MKCPSCSSIDNKVTDSRLLKDGEALRRRRECLACSYRFTTYEQVENPMPLVIKNDGRRETFDAHKLLNGLKKSCEKRPVSINKLEELIKEVEKYLSESGEKEIPSALIGERVMIELHKLDDIAYVRYASVYRSFKDINDFMDEIRGILIKKEGEK